MKFKEITIERNFHILNDDRFIMEKVSATIQLDDYDDEQLAMNTARAQIIDNFKAAYPKVYTHLNFDESIDKPHRTTQWLPLPTDYVNAATIKVEQSSEKINKGTIEDQIQACTTMDSLLEWKLLANANKSVKNAYDNKLKELTPTEKY